MIRGAIGASSQNAAMVLTGGNGSSFQYRSVAGGTTVNAAWGDGATVPCWVRLTRLGTTFTGYASSDGVTWRTVGSIEIAMGTDIYAGVAVTSHDAAGLNISLFDNVTMDEPDLAPAIRITSPSPGASFTSGTIVEFTADATDDRGVALVTWYVDGQEAGATGTAPYRMEWIAAGEGAHSIEARVRDTGGNQAVSEPVVITVKASPEIVRQSRINSIGLTAGPLLYGVSHQMRNFTAGTPVSGAVKGAGYRMKLY
jgi:hypothetical protein